MASSLMKWVVFFLTMLQFFCSSSGLIRIPKIPKVKVRGFVSPQRLDNTNPKNLFNQNPKSVFNQNPKNSFNQNPKSFFNQNPKTSFNQNPKTFFNQNPKSFFNQNPKNSFNQNPKSFFNQNPKSFFNQNPKNSFNQNPKNLYKTNHEYIATKEFGENLAKKYFGDEFIKGFRWGLKLKKRILSVARKCNKLMKVFESLCPQPVQISTWSDIVHCIVEVTSFEYNETCLPWYESRDYPQEATCILDQLDTLGSKNCTT